jgi:O-antigen biosynthesis protein
MTDEPIPILVYHSVDVTCARAYRRWMVTPERFARQMGYLADREYHPVSVSALTAAFVTGAQLPPRPVAITFDDGLRDFRTGALPILERFHLPATLFVVAGYVGAKSRWLGQIGEGDRPMLSWSELRELDAAGIECGAHSFSHPQLDIIAPDAAVNEITDSKRALEDGLGRPVRSFAYPHGYATPALRRAVQSAGFDSACRVGNALSSRRENPYALSRIIVTEDVTEEDLDNLLSDRHLQTAPPPDRLISYGWRVVRRLRSLLRFATHNASAAG